MNNNNEDKNMKDCLEHVYIALDKPIDPSIREKIEKEIKCIRKIMLRIIATESLRVKDVCDEHGLDDLADKCLCVVPQRMYEVTKTLLEGDGACVIIDEKAMIAILKPVFSLLNVLLTIDDMKAKGIIE